LTNERHPLHRWIVENLSDLDVLIVDCQTTGASPAHGVVLELGWGVARASVAEVQRLEAHWLTLPPGHAVTYQVRRLTGFDESSVNDALGPREAWTRLRASMNFAARTPAAIHFAKFELAFLRDWAGRFEPEATFPIDAICVHAIACRLYPDLPRRSLRALAGFLGHGLDPARRCLGHVEATAFIWRKLTCELATLGVHTWDQLSDWLASPTAPRVRKRRYPLPSARYRALPDEPGVYRFLRSNGDVLYVGKAASLRKRVAGHFTAGSSTTERALEMLTQVHEIRVTPTRTPLEAALLENEDIKALKPPYNVQLVGADPRTWFSSASFDAASTVPDETHRCGPLPSTFSVRALGAIQALMSGESATRSLRARAVGAPDRWAPGEAAFLAGFACFAERHSLGDAAFPNADIPRSQWVRRSLDSAARKLILAAKTDASKIDSELDDDDVNAGASELGTWDPDRIVRHLERAITHAYQLLQRARWLCLLYDSAIIFREPPSERSRLLLVQDGRLVASRDLLPDEPIDVTDRYRPLSGRKEAFDRSHYDRLRTLTTELKRVRRDGGTAAVRVGRGRWLRGSKLDALLLWV
jgi:DNA polymerase-3 subunit epsilon